MGYSTVCDAVASGKIKGTGRSGKGQAGAEQELFWTPSDFSFTSKSSAVSISDWNTAVAAGNAIYLGVIEEFDANDTEATFYESANGNLRLKTAEAKRVRQYRLVECSCTHASLLSLDGQNGRLLIRTSRGYLKARIEDDGTVVGFKTNQFDVGLLTAATTESPSFTPIDVTFATPIDDDKDVFEDSIDFEFSQVDQVFNASLSASSITQSGTLDFTLRINKDCSDVALSGVLESNLIVEDVNGNVLSKTLTPSGDSYDISVTTALSSAIVYFDGVQNISSVLYTSEDLTVSV